jgi:Uma2 family endonuclease
VDDYHRMGEAGILLEDDRVELIYGEIVTMSPIGNPHNAAIDRANRALNRLLGDSAIVRVQGSVRLDRYNEPQPDIVLLKPRDDFYKATGAGPADILVIVEFADSSIEYDRRVKSRLYGEMHIPEYWVVDLNEECVFVYSDSINDAYRLVRQFRRGQEIIPTLLPDYSVAVQNLLA